MFISHIIQDSPLLSIFYTLPPRAIPSIFKKHIHPILKHRNDFLFRSFHSHPTPFSCLSIYQFSHIIRHSLITTDTTHYIVDSTILYAIHSPFSPRVYIGQSIRYISRSYTHTLNCRIYINHSSPINSFTPSQRQKVYRFISQHPYPCSFSITPLIRVHSSQANTIEKIFIKLLGSRALNQDHIAENTLVTRNLSAVSTSRSRQTNSRSRRRTLLRTSFSTPRLPHHSHPIPYHPACFRSSIHPATTFLSLSFLLFLSLTSRIPIHIHASPGLITHNFHSLLFSYGRSRVYNLPPYTHSSQFLSSLPRQTIILPTSFIITPRRSSNPFHITLNMCTALLSKHFSPLLTHKSVFFWITLFRTANTLSNPTLTTRIRAYIRNYVFISFSLSTRALSTNISFNIFLPYHPNINLSHLHHTHRILLDSLLPSSSRKYILPLRIILSRPPALHTLLFNQRPFLKSFNHSSPPPCVCNLPPSTLPQHHLLHLPSQLPLSIQPAIRNLDQPITAQLPIIRMHFINTLITIITRVYSYRSLPPLPTSPITLLMYPKSLTFFTSATTHLHLSFTTLHKLLLFLYHVNFLHISTSLSIFVSLVNTLSTFHTSYSQILDILITFLPSPPHPKLTAIFHSLGTKPYHHLPHSLIPTFPLLHTWLLAAILATRTTIPSHTISLISKHYANSLPLTSPITDPQQHTHTHNLTHWLKSNSQFIFIPVDHNTRQPAQICPFRFHHVVSQHTIEDTLRFTHLTTGAILLDHVFTSPPTASFIHTLVSTNIKTAWAKHKSKGTHSQAKFAFYVKEDGVRFRLIGSYASIAHAPLFSLYSSSLIPLLKFTHLDVAVLHDTAHSNPLLHSLTGTHVLIHLW